MNCKKETLLVIYKCTNNINGKIYIGKTSKGLQNRIRSHKSDYLSFRDKGRITYPLYNAFKKYGFENFSWEIIDEAETEEELNEKEIYWIDKSKSLVNYGKGYNINKGGTGGDNFTNNPRKEEIREKFRNRKYPKQTRESINRRRESFKKTIENRTFEQRRAIGNKLSEKLKKYYENHVSANCGKSPSVEVRSRISRTLKGRFSGENNPNYNNKWSEEKKKNLSEYFRKNRDYKGNLNPNCKEVRYYNLETEEIETYFSRKEFCEKYGFKYDTVEQNSKYRKIIGKRFIFLSENIENFEEFISEIKSKSRWF